MNDKRQQKAREAALDVVKRERALVEGGDAQAARDVREHRVRGRGLLLPEREDRLAVDDVYNVEVDLADMGVEVKPKVATILGYGAVGKATADQLRARGYEVWVDDTSPAAMERAREDGCLATTRDEALAHGRLLYGCTGRGALTEDDYAKLPDGAVLANAASGNHELGATSTACLIPVPVPDDGDTSSDESDRNDSNDNDDDNNNNDDNNNDDNNNDDNHNNDPPPPPSEGEGEGEDNDDTGATCSENSDCDNNTCLKGVDEDGNFTDFGYCTKPCESFADCPTFWDCTDVGNAVGTFCVQD
jgi:threonine dehydrogenase-like Zn-dependent dehydrogenase